MTEPKSKSEGPLSVGARTYIRSLTAQEIFGVEFEISSKAIEKGLECEEESIGLLNRVMGTSLSKNTERRTSEFLTGECDLFDTPARRGYDLKTSWSLATFPIVEADCVDKLYEWQMRGYMALWDADDWVVAYGMVNTPERLIGFEPLALHVVDHLPPEHRLTTWKVTRDAAIERAIEEKVRHARAYMHQVIDEFDRTHRGGPLEAVIHKAMSSAPAQVSIAQAPVTAPDF